MENEVQAFLDTLIKSLVSKPEAVTVERKVDEMGVLYTVDVDGEDMGRIIGRSGNTAKAIRTLLRVVGQNFGERSNMKINEPENGLRADEFNRKDAAPAPSAAEAGEVDAAIDELKADF